MMLKKETGKIKRCFKDIQFGDNKKFMTSWCHGAAGILLSRVKCYDEMYLGRISHEGY